MTNIAQAAQRRRVMASLLNRAPTPLPAPFETKVQRDQFLAERAVIFVDEVYEALGGHEVRQTITIIEYLLSEFDNQDRDFRDAWIRAVWLNFRVRYLAEMIGGEDDDEDEE